MTEHLTLRPPRVRQDLHNSHCDTLAAQAGFCGETHLASGRVCYLPAGHPGSCRFDYDRRAGAPPRSGAT